MATSLAEAFALALELHDCRDCINAHVGPGAVCHCHRGHWRERTLREVRYLRRECDDYEPSSDE